MDIGEDERKVAEIRFVRREGYKEAAELADAVFRDAEHTSMSYGYPAIFSGAYECSPGVYEDGKLAAFLGLVPNVLQIGGAAVPLFSVGSVCTDPAFRGRGFADAMLKLAFEHMAESGASLLFVSGGLNLYLRNGCRPFGSARREIREARQADWFRLQELYDGNPVRYRRSLFETAELLKAKAVAGNQKQDHRILVASKDGELVAYAVLGVPGEIAANAAPFVAEWGGDEKAAAELFANAVLEWGLTELRVVVPWNERDMDRTLQSAGYEAADGNLDGTVKLTDPVLFWKQIRPYLAERDAEAAGRVDLLRADPATGDSELAIDGRTVALPYDDLLKLLFGAGTDAAPAIPALEPHADLLAKLFPIPLPHPGGLNFV